MKEDEDGADMKVTSTPVKDEGRDDSSRLSSSPDRDLPADYKRLEIHNRTVPGNCCALNRGSLSWGQDGCLAYGCGSLVVVVEAATSQYLQVLARHKHPVVRTAWSEAEDRRLCLASADSLGQIIVWNVVQVHTLVLS